MPFQPGQSGNPAGKPKQKIWRDTLLLALNREDGVLPLKGKTNLETLVLTQIHAGMKGDMQAIKDMADRIDGKPAQSLVGGDEGDNPVRILQEVRRTIVDPRSPNS